MHVLAFTQYKCGAIFWSLAFVPAVMLWYPGTSVAKLVDDRPDPCVQARALSFEETQEILVKIRNLIFSFLASSWSATAADDKGEGNHDMHKRDVNQSDDGSARILSTTTSAASWTKRGSST